MGYLVALRICVHGCIYNQKLLEAHLEGCTKNDSLTIFFCCITNISI